MDLVRLLYFSRCRIDISDAAGFSHLTQILDVSDRNNKARGITGALVFDSNWFVQALEGAADEVWSTFKKVERDKRHSDVSFLEMTKVPSRRFGNWWMCSVVKDGNNTELFKPYLYNGRFMPDTMAGSVMLSLLTDLAWDGFVRDLSAARVTPS
jgi:blue light- and temperature-responsive anti-repressor